MASVKETLEITMRKDVTCQAGSSVLAMTKGLAADEKLSAKLVIGEVQKQGKWCVYLDEESEDNTNLVAKVVAITNNEGAFDDVDIEILVQEGNYQIILTGPQENIMNGKIQILKDEASANKKSDEGLSKEIQQIMEEKITAGIVTKEEMDARIKVMKDNYVDSFLMKRVIQGYRKYNKPAHTPSCLYVDPYLETSRKQKVEGIISEGLRAAVGRQAIICEGEKSTGKNVYLETISWLMGMPMYLITFSRQMSPASIYGEKTTDNGPAEALAAFDESILAKADIIKEKMRFAASMMSGKTGHLDKLIQASLSDEDKKVLEQAKQFEVLKAKAASVNIVIDASELYDWLSDGGLICFNEMNMAEANFFASFTNQLLDGTGFLFIPGRGEVPVNPDCVLFGTQNADYQGVEQQNEATMSRFGCIEFRQPESIKKQLVAAVTAKLEKDGFSGVKLDSKYYTACETFYKQCRGAVRKAQVSNAVLNIRGFVRALTAVAESDGYTTLERQVQIHVVCTCPTDERQPLLDILKNVVSI